MSNSQKKSIIKPGAISVCMIVKNEEKLLGRCLKSVEGIADELVIVDTGSTDSTVEIARSFGAKVIEVQWRNDFAWARNISLQHATCEWILWLDADDVVPVESRSMLNELKTHNADRVYAFIVRNERPGNTGTEFMQARMFPNRPDIFFERSIHEQMMPSALRLGVQMENQNVVIEHHGYAEPDVLKLKAARNVQMLLKELENCKDDAVMMLEIADSYLLSDAYDSAALWYNNVLKIPNCTTKTPAIAAAAFCGLGTISLNKEHFEDAALKYEQALSISPWRLDVSYNRAVALEMAGDIGTALECLNSVVMAQPQPGQVGVDFRAAKIKTFLRMTRILAESGELDQAECVITEGVKSFPNRQELHNMAGKIFLKKNKLMEALHAFEKSINLIKQGNIDAYAGLCFIYKIAGKQDLALQTVLSIEPLFVDNPKYYAFKKHILNESPTPLKSNSDPAFETLQKDFFHIF